MHAVPISHFLLFYSAMIHHSISGVLMAGREEEEEQEKRRKRCRLDASDARRRRGWGDALRCCVGQITKINEILWNGKFFLNKKGIFLFFRHGIQKIWFFWFVTQKNRLIQLIGQKNVLLYSCSLTVGMFIPKRSIYNIKNPISLP